MADINIITNTFVAGTDALAAEVNANFTDVNQLLNGDLDSYLPAPVLVPIGAIVAWHKTWGTADSGTTTSTSANKLVQTGQNFDSTVLSGMIVFNSTDSTFANVTAVDSATTLSLSADVMTSGENFTIYKTPLLPDGWLECDGSTISDADSPLDGVAVPNLNGTTDASKAFIRGVDANTTDNSVSDATHIHSSNNTISASGSGGSSAWDGGQPTTTATRAVPPYAEMVWIIRIK
jgi:hypothetical protein